MPTVFPDSFPMMLFLAVLLSMGLEPAAVMGTTPVRFTILHTGDLHSSFAGKGPDGCFDPAGKPGDLVRGHYARLAHLIRSLRATRKADHEAVLPLDSGDAEYGTLFHIVTPSGSRPMAPEGKLIHDLGYGAIRMDNHPFEGTGPGRLMALDKAASLSLAGSQSRGEHPPTGEGEVMPAGAAQPARSSTSACRETA